MKAGRDHSGPAQLPHPEDLASALQLKKITGAPASHDSPRWNRGLPLSAKPPEGEQGIVPLSRNGLWETNRRDVPEVDFWT
jgi:hypothetical protein